MTKGNGDRRGKHPNSLKNLRHFEPGYSPNPGGKRKVHTSSILAELRKLMDEEIETPQGRKRMAEVIARAAVAAAAKGNSAVLKEVLDRLEGPVRQEIATTVTESVKVIELEPDGPPAPK